MSEHFQIQCPGCQKILKVPASMGGKVVDCPSCKTALQIAATNTSPQSPPLNINLPTDVPTSQQSAPVVTPPQSAIPHSPAPFQGDPLAPLPNSPSAAPGAGWQSATPQKRKYAKTKTTKRNDEEPETTESALANIGYFLVVTAVLATVLPLFGLQLRRLRNAGEYAPLIGMFLGLIGSGLIAAGGNARNRAQSFGIAGGCALLVVVLGIAGFVIQSNGIGGDNAMAGQNRLNGNDEARQKKELERIKNSDRPFPNQNRPTIPNLNSPNLNSPKNAPAPFDPFADAKERREQAAAKAKKFMEDAQQRNSDILDSAQKHLKDAQRDLANNTPSSSPFSTPASSPFSSRNQARSPGRSNLPTAGNNPFKSNNNSTNSSKPPTNNSNQPKTDDTPPTKNPNNPFDSSANSNSPIKSNNSSGAGSFFDMLERQNEGLDTLRLRISGNADLESNYKFVKIAGADNAFGKVFYQNKPLDGIEFGQFKQRSILIPADKSLPKHDKRIDVPEGMALVGLNFFIKNGKIIGVQCVFASPHEKREGRYDVGNTTTSDWLGDETDSPITTITTGKPVVGLAVFRDARSITGVQLIIAKK